MIMVSGLAKITSGPFFYTDSGKGYGADLIVEFAKGKTLQLISPNYIMTECLQPLQTGHSVRFEGYLDSEDPGLYIVKLTAIRRSKR